MQLTWPILSKDKRSLAWSDVLSLINFKIEFLPPILILVTISWFILFARWQILLKNSNIIIPLRSSFAIFISGFSLQFIPGEVGEFLKAQLLKNKFNISDSSKANFDVDSKILGGIKVRIGNKIIDGSVSTKLKKIKQSLLGI